MDHNELESLKRAHLHLMVVVTQGEWPPNGDLVEALALVTEQIMQNDPDFETIELAGRRVHMDGCYWSNGVIVCPDTNFGKGNAYHVYSKNTGDLETYILGKNMELAKRNVPYTFS